ncbi:MAG: hypothetical protein JNM68_12560, partial [Dinghuibacter sp.]|nr:hypothetical protein [Dinghuibacter sp.]
MMQIPEHIAALAEKYLNGSATEAEMEVINNWYRSFNDEIAEPGIPGDETVVGERIRNRLLQTIREKDNVRQLKPRKRLV